MAKIRAATNYRTEALSSGWQLAEPPAGSSTQPSSRSRLDPPALGWLPALCPGTVASALRAQNAWDFDTLQNFDASDWWYRTRFHSTPCLPGEGLWLELDGLATLADVWLNGTHVLASDNMFCAHELDVSSLVRADNELVIRFSSLDQESRARRPRPRFKTRLIERQQLRWFRTTLLGRIPGWTPPVTAVGPWRPVRLVRKQRVAVRTAELNARVDAGRALVTAKLELDLLGARLHSAELHVGGARAAFARADDESVRLEVELVVPGAELWWPNGYGPQPRYPARVQLETDAGSCQLTFDPLAFRELAIDTAGDRFALRINDREIRCRGACWTPSDIVSLADDVSTVATIEQARAAGMNMLRVGGTMIYESDAFYEECERSGLLVWQDFMFANCDYPAEDEAFRQSVTREAEQFLRRSETRACLAVLCGNSEVEQQVAMLGLPRELWKSPIFEDLLRGIAHSRRPDVPYVSSTPTGGALPFQVNAGLSHYYGVGAYLRPLEDARRADVKFTPECLGFSNIPEDSTVALLLGDRHAPFHGPRWKSRVPRDNGPGWDFDDIRDHYTKLLFGADPTALRYEDAERALALGRVTSGEVMARTLAEWRRGASSCRGALIWFLRDLWPGSGWGLIDALGLPKAAYYFVKRAMQPQTLFVTDEGLNGLRLHVVNDSPQPLVAQVELELIRNGSVRVARGFSHVTVPAHETLELESALLFDHFIDLSHAYRFGPTPYDVGVASLRDAQTSAILAETCHFPRGLPAERAEDLGLTARVEAIGDDAWRLHLQSQRFAYAVALDLPEFTTDDSYFQLVPGRERCVALRATVPAAKPRGFARPLNSQLATRITPG